MEANKSKTGKIMFRLSVLMFFISSVAILFMPLGSFEPDGNILLAYILAGTFITVFSLEMHCMLNGKNYEWLYC